MIIIDNYTGYQSYSMPPLGEYFKGFCEVLMHLSVSGLLIIIYILMVFLLIVLYDWHFTIWFAI
jgi:hypothetical protein